PPGVPLPPRSRGQDGRDRRARIEPGPSPCSRAAPCRARTRLGPAPANRGGRAPCTRRLLLARKRLRWTVGDFDRPTSARCRPPRWNVPARRPCWAQHSSTDLRCMSKIPTSAPESGRGHRRWEFGGRPESPARGRIQKKGTGPRTPVKWPRQDRGSLEQAAQPLANGPWCSFADAGGLRCASPGQTRFWTPSHRHFLVAARPSFSG
ncbi:hypothetical protein T484DRAFT_3289428, partial [Baffinella frigidus]